MVSFRACAVKICSQLLLIEFDRCILSFEEVRLGSRVENDPYFLPMGCAGSDCRSVDVTYRIELSPESGLS